MKHILLLMVLALTALGQPRSSRDYVLTRWNLEDGLPQSSVNAIVQTRDGYLWLATFGGLVRFDGVRFTVFDRGNTLQMASDRCINLFESSDGTLWVGTEGGIVTMRDGVFRSYGKAEGLNGDIVTRIHQDANDQLWVATTRLPIQYFRNGAFHNVPMEHAPVASVRALSDSSGTYLPLVNTICRTHNGRMMQMTDPGMFTQRTLWDVLRARDGSIWIASNGDGVFRFSNNGTRHFAAGDGLVSPYVHLLYEDQDGGMWIGTDKGLSRFDGRTFLTISTEQGLPDNSISSICQDREGNIWIGTPTGGLTRLRRSLFQMYDKRDGLAEDKMLSICERADGTILLGTNCGGIYELRNGGIQYSSLNRLVRNSCIWSIFEDRKRALWFSSGDLLQIGQAGNVTVHEKRDLDDGFIYSINEDRSGTVWVGTGSGLFAFDGVGRRRYTRQEGLAGDEVRVTFEDRSGRLWIGTTDGLNVIDHGVVQPHKIIPGVFSQYVRTIHQDVDGMLWFGTYGGGIVRLKDTTFRVITAKDGLFDNIVSHILEDEQGYFWMGCNRGISRIKRSELNDFADGKISRVHSRSFGKPEGLTSIETNGGFQPSAIRGQNGVLYFPTVGGVATVHPNDLQGNDAPPPVKIERVNAEDSTYVRGPFEVPYSNSNLSFEYTALSYIDPARIRFRYRLEGFDEEWIDAGTRRVAYYTKPSPGPHEFHVIAANSEGVWNETGASIRFTVLPPFYMTWWFRALGLLFFLAVGPSIYYKRVTGLKRDQAQQQETLRLLIDSQEKERSRIAQELHDSLGQELLIVKNRALMGIKATDTATGARKQLEQISDGVSRVLKSVREISHDLRPPELDRLGITETLRSTIDGLSESGAIAVDARIDPIDGIIPKDLQINLVRIVQECTNNIIRHARATYAEITIIRRPDALELTVRDNGIGFDPAIVSQPSVGLGMTGIHERTRMLGGTLGVISSPGEGTTVRILIPLDQKGWTA